MAVNEIHIDSPPRDVFAILADPESYGKWVVGSSQIRDVEGPWPAEGSTFHHTQGVGPVGIKDTTSVLESEPDRMVKLEVRARPLVVAHVHLALDPEGDGTKVTMTEVPMRGLMGRLPKRLSSAAIKPRNAISLRRLRRLANRR